MKTTPCSVQYTKSTVFFGLDLTPKAKWRQYWQLTKTFRSPNSFFPPKHSFDSEKRSSRPFFAYNIPKATNNQRRSIREDLEKPLKISVPCELMNVLSSCRSRRPFFFLFHFAWHGILTVFVQINIANKRSRKKETEKKWGQC